jgi:hypothetical protein
MDSYSQIPVVRIFCHSSEVQRSGLLGLRKGQKLIFDIAEDCGKQSGRNLRIRNAKTAGERVISDPKRIWPGLAAWRQRGIMKRRPITLEYLQSAIAKAVRETDTECEALIGVFVERIVPASRGDVNWALKGVRYGKAERAKCDAAIAVVVERLQLEYIVSDGLK